MFHVYTNHSKNALLDFKRKDAFHFKWLLLNFEKNPHTMIPPKKYFIVPLIIKTNLKNVDHENNYEKLLKDSNYVYTKLKFFVYIYNQKRFIFEFASNNYLKHLIKTFLFLNKKLLFLP